MDIEVEKASRRPRLAAAMWRAATTGTSTQVPAFREGDFLSARNTLANLGASDSVMEGGTHSMHETHYSGNPQTTRKALLLEVTGSRMCLPLEAYARGMFAC